MKRRHLLLLATCAPVCCSREDISSSFSESQMRGLQKLVRINEYGIPHPERIKIVYNHKDFKVDDLRDFNPYTRKGRCLELTVKGVVDLSKIGYEVTFVEGNDPHYFTTPRTPHDYLFVSKRDILDGRGRITDPEEIGNITKKNPLVYDPTFQRVVPFSGSGYKVHEIYHKGIVRDFLDSESNSQVFQNLDGFPFAMTSNGAIVYLVFNLNSPHLFHLGIQEFEGQVKECKVEELENMLRDETEILRTIEILKRVDKMAVHGDLRG
ncbi:hypothetical protein ACFLZX_02645 [Nanoarchaeota archaeon]